MAIPSQTWIKAGKGNNVLWQKVVRESLTKHRPKGGRKAEGREDWGQGWGSLELPHSDGNRSDLCA